MEKIAQASDITIQANYSTSRDRYWRNQRISEESRKLEKRRDKSVSEKIIEILRT